MFAEGGCCGPRDIAAPHASCIGLINDLRNAVGVLPLDPGDSESENELHPRV